MSDKNRFAGLLELAVGAFLLWGVPHAFAACGADAHGMFMKCHWSQQAVAGAGGVAAALGVLHLLLPRAARAGVDLALAVLGVYVILVPRLFIGVCAHEMMQCRTYFLPAATLGGAVLIELGLTGGTYLLTGGRKVKRYGG